MGGTQPDKIDARPLGVGATLRTCPECGYTAGFHVTLERSEGPAQTNVALKLLCPSCKAVYDVGLRAFLD